MFIFLHTLYSCFFFLGTYQPSASHPPLPASSTWSQVTFPFAHDVPATLAFFLCLTLTELFCLKVLVMLYEKCLSKLLSQLAPSRYSNLSLKSPERHFLNSLSKVPSCPATNPSIREVLQLCCASHSLDNLLKHRLLHQFLIQQDPEIFISNKF